MQSPHSQAMRDELTRKQATRKEKLARILTRPQEKSALREAQREATEARRAADEAKRRAEAAK
jgi:hypothetical protein